MAWTTADIPEQSGRVAIVTGANAGIGYVTARELAKKGARVVLACRSESRGKQALSDLKSEVPDADAVLMHLDLSSLDSVRIFAAQVQERFERLDLLINNAGVMIPPLTRTEEGFELQFGVNHLGHFALTQALLPLLEHTEGARVVSVSSNAHKQGSIDFDDPNFERRPYSKVGAYCQSKLANLLFTLELNQRVRGSGVIATAAHPGWTYTELTRTAWWADLPSRLLGQSVDQGALPTLRAATDPTAEAGDYFGPRGLGEMRGTPVKVGRTRAAEDEATARRLWTLSEALIAEAQAKAAA